MNNSHMAEEIREDPITLKPVELYVFLDPIHEKSWELQAIIRKMQIEYGHYFSIRMILSAQLMDLNRACKDPNVQAEEFSHPALPSVAVKAAELQGKRAGNRYLYKLQEYQMLLNEDVSSYPILMDIARSARLDEQEFAQDFYSVHTARAFQCDLNITREMEIEEMPSIVFFNECIEDEGVKLSGLFPYEIYRTVLEEMLGGKEMERQEPPALDKLLKTYTSLTTREIAEIYHVTEKAAEYELKKQVLQQRVERIFTPNETLWSLK